MPQNELERKRKLILFLSMNSRWYQSYFIYSLIDLIHKRNQRTDSPESRLGVMG